ncbi:2-succinyl-5-enolpyruvyl-6-hydroxy-3-cyclohexene-1-carboxylic-acid synthase [Bacteroidota bacterium]
MCTNKLIINYLVEVCLKKGIDYLITSPGSRNAPIIIAFNKSEKIKCLSISDERSAAFFALGIAQQTNKTVALACTSGTAVLNYAPAIAEAYYQKVPLLILTADRPEEWTDQGDGQTIRQKNIFNNYIKKDYQLPLELIHEDDIWHLCRIISEAINLTTYPDSGPVHINIPLREPLYNQKNVLKGLKPKIIDIVAPEFKIKDEEIKKLLKVWNGYKKILILTGTLNKNDKLNELLNELSKKNSVVIITETTSNLYGKNYFCCIDKLISNMSEDEQDKFRPELLITLGGNVISKKIKALLRNKLPDEHWHISPNNLHIDTYQALTKNICVNPSCFFDEIIKSSENNSSDYYSDISEIRNKRELNHKKFLEKAPYSDLKVFELILKNIPDNSNLQLANSTPVRYTQLFQPYKNLNYYSNRGTSGIDGCLSTAIGASYVNPTPITLIIGDIAFFYDSNGLWNNYINSNFRIILINNSGGNIFRIIDGPDKTDELETYFEANQNISAKGISETFNLNYYSADNFIDIENVLGEFYNYKNNKPAILEIKTPNKINAKVLKEYFTFLNKT